MSWIKNNEWLTAKPATEVYWPYLRRFAKTYAAHVKLLGLASLCSLLASAAVLLIPLAFRMVQTALSRPAGSKAMYAVVLYAVLLVLQTALFFVVRALRTHVTAAINSVTLLTYYKRLLSVSVPDFLRIQRTTNFFQRLVDAMGITGQYMEILVDGIQSLLLTAAILAVILVLSPPIFFISSAGVVALFALTVSQTPKMRSKRQALLAVNYPLVGKMQEIIINLLTNNCLAASPRVTKYITLLTERRRPAELDEQLF